MQSLSLSALLAEDQVYTRRGPLNLGLREVPTGEVIAYVPPPAHWPLIPASQKKDLIFETSRMLKMCPWFAELPTEHVLLAGGALYTHAARKTTKDFDLFIYGLPNTQEADKVVWQIVDVLLKHYPKCHVTATDYLVKIHRPDKPAIEIVLSLYRDISEILHSFDLGSSALGFDGKKFWTTDLGWLALERRVNIFQLEKASASYLPRLKKYFQRGFGIVFPQLSMNLFEPKLKKSGSVVFPKFTIQKYDEEYCFHTLEGEGYTHEGDIESVLTNDGIVFLHLPDSEVGHYVKKVVKVLPQYLRNVVGQEICRMIGEATKTRENFHINWRVASLSARTELFPEVWTAAEVYGSYEDRGQKSEKM